MEYAENTLKAKWEGHFINFFIPQKEEGDNEPLDAETFETGVLTLYGYQGLVLAVGDSSITIGTDINVNTPQFQWLGYEQLEHEKQCIG